MPNLPQGDGVVLQGALREAGARNGAVVLRRMVDEAFQQQTKVQLLKVTAFF